ncbi:MlrC family protein 3 [Paraburkholderia sp. 1N]|uniref:Microcystinase C n=1 Tax=Paraburkholderia solitsugae TaxID=2675748 RepID=A0ABX2BKG0_9BURK|nr:M81 family metallopeptidase [Paraburkholderia solitsugae]NPT41417.1 MlrC family protein 3 [Paraburkholderia solitsugae]
MKSPRIAILGFAIESNRFAPVATRADFVSRAYLPDAALLADARSDAPVMTPEIPAFVRTMDTIRPWTPVPILFANAESGGPVEHEFFTDTLREFEQRLRAALPLDAVYICEHGAAITTEEHDPDGVVFTLVRRVVGPAVPIVATVDLHANVSDRMVDAVDTLVSYRRNPHTDMAERGADAARILTELVDGMRTAVAHVRMPVCAPPTQLLTAPGTGPYAEMIRRAEALDDPRIVNVSIVGGFAFADTPKNGLTVLVTTRGDAPLAAQVANDLASYAWRERAAFTPRLTPVEDAVRLAKITGDDPSRAPLLLADVADNPGGGGRGNTPFMLKALLEHEVRGAILGVVTDPELAADAHAAGTGHAFHARFNRAETTAYSEPFEAPARVLRLHAGKGVGRRGQLAGCSFDLGPSAALQLGGVTVIVISKRHQCHEPMFFEMFGIDIARARVVVLKSRGHFRAAFDEFFSDAQIVSVDAPGLTSPILSRFDFTGMPRPVVPLDNIATWMPKARTVLPGSNAIG